MGELGSRVEGRDNASCLLLSFDFGKSTRDMRMLWIQVAGLVKGGGRFGKFPLCQARVAVRKRLMRQDQRRNCLWGGRFGIGPLTTPTSESDPSDGDNRHDDDYAFHGVPFWVACGIPIRCLAALAGWVWLVTGAISLYLV